MFIMGIDPTRVDTTAKWRTGTIGANTDNGAFKVYKYVLYDKGTADVDGVAGEAAYYVASTGYAAATVTSDLSDSSEVGAGILMANVGDEYCWIQIKGHATMSIALTTDEDGTPLTPTGAGDGALEVVGAFTEHACAVSINGGDKTIICDFPY